MIAQSRNHKWLQQHDEAILEPELPIIDPHHHLWDKNTNHLVQPRYLLDEILEDINCGHNIVATVFIECGAMFKVGGDEPFVLLEKQNLLMALLQCASLAFMVLLRSLRLS